MKEVDVNSASAGEIMTPYVVMLSNNATFQELINTLHNHKISAVFIHDDDKFDYYIISQTDIINFLENEGLFRQDLANVIVTEIMQGPIEMLDIDIPVDHIIRYMAKKKYKRLLISKENQPVGVISTRDIMKWNDTYFRPAKPQVLLIMDNYSSNFIAKQIFDENVSDVIESELIDIYGGALNAISVITNEVIKQSGKLYHLRKDKRSLLFEPYKNITGILISDYNSIELRRKLIKATHKFYEVNKRLMEVGEKQRGIFREFGLDSVTNIFK